MIKRILTGSAANLFGVTSNAVIQLLSVPILSKAFGLEGYGIWLLISTFPYWLVVADLGLTTAATSEMAIRFASGDTDRVGVVFQSLSIVMLAIFAPLVIIVWIGTSIWGASSGLWSTDLAPHVVAIPLLTTYAALALFTMLPVAALRATGDYARATLMHDGATFLESLSILIVAAITNDLVKTALAPVLIRSIAIVIIFVLTLRWRPFLQLGLARVNLSEIKRLMPAALGALAIPVGLALNLQGTVAVIGIVLGPVAVAIFAPVRTLSRLGIQGVGIVNRAMLPELAAATGRHDRVVIDRCWSINRKLILFALFPAATLFALLGVDFIDLWTNGRIVPPQNLVNLIALALFLHGIWYFGITLLTASHDHIGVGKYVVGACVIGVVGTGLMASHLGLAGAALGVVLADALLVPAIVMTTRRARKASLMTGRV